MHCAGPEGIGCILKALGGLVALLRVDNVDERLPLLDRLLLGKKHARTVIIVILDTSARVGRDDHSRVREQRVSSGQRFRVRHVEDCAQQAVWPVDSSENVV